MLEKVRVDYKVKRRRSIADLERRIDKHIKPALGWSAAEDITEVEITSYIVERQARGAANATIKTKIGSTKPAIDSNGNKKGTL